MVTVVVGVLAVITGFYGMNFAHTWPAFDVRWGVPFALDAEEPPERDAEIRLGEKVVGRVTSAAPADGRVVALAYVRVDVPEDAELRVGAAAARSLH